MHKPRRNRWYKFVSTDGQTDGFQYTPPNFVAGGIITAKTRPLYTRLKDNTLHKKWKQKKNFNKC